MKKLKKWQPFIITDEDDESLKTHYALYAGYNLSKKYPDSLHFWLFVEWAFIWERHSFDDRVDYREIDKDEEKKIMRLIFEAKSWDISS